MAKCAREIIQQNGFGDKIRLIPKRSTDITVGRGNIRSFYDTYILFLTSFHVKDVNTGTNINVHYYDIHLIEWDTIEFKMLTKIKLQMESLEF